MNPKDNYERVDMSENAAALASMLNGYQSTAILYVAAKLDLADILSRRARDSGDLACALGAHPSSLHRILRALVVLGVCREEDDGRFTLTALGTLLRSDVPGSLNAMAVICGEEYFGAWGGLLHTVMTGETAFDHVFGMSQWEHRQEQPELSRQFGSDLAQETARAALAIVKAYDFSLFGTVADIGSGRGALLAAILNTCPKATGILFDKQHVIEEARGYMEEHGVAERCRFVPGDFFDSLCENANVYVMKSIIHDWNDEKSGLILSNCRAALNANSRLLLAERIMPQRVAEDPSTILLDVQMLATTGGRERTEAEYRALLSAAGFKLTRIIPTTTAFYLIEALPV